MTSVYKVLSDVWGTQCCLIKAAWYVHFIHSVSPANNTLKESTLLLLFYTVYALIHMFGNHD